jgi:hypothetical protein
LLVVTELFVLAVVAILVVAELLLFEALREATMNIIALAIIKATMPLMMINTLFDFRPGGVSGVDKGAGVSGDALGVAIVDWMMSFDSDASDLDASAVGSKEILSGRTSVGGGSVVGTSGIRCVAWGSNGADKTAPSIRQKVNESSNVRLHVGQLFILHLR